MKKARLTAIVILALIGSLAASLQFVNVTKANLIPYPRKADNSLPVVLIQSPSNGSYNTDIIQVNFTITMPDSWFVGGVWGKITWIYFYMDENRTVLAESSPFNEPDHSAAIPKTESYSITLTGLTQGKHAFQVNVGGASYYNSIPEPDYHIVVNTNIVSTISTTLFTVDTTPPTITMVSPQNTSYALSPPLSFIVDEQTSWMGYSVDSQANTTLTGNATVRVKGFSVNTSTHNLTVYANDTAGNMGASETVEFVLPPIRVPSFWLYPTDSQTQQPTSEPSPTAYGTQVENYTPIIIIFGLVIVAAVIGVLVYFKKIKK